jgi:hypothetical protein
MNTAQLLQFSLKNSFDILNGVTEDLTQEQADWQPPGTALSIGTLYWHTISGADFVVHSWCQGQSSLSETAGWEEKVVLHAEPQQEGDHAASVRAVRIDLTAMHDYARAVAEAALGWLASMSPEGLEQQIKSPIGELNLGQMLETFVVWHVSAHCGEISALKGCQGARGYPF